MPTVPLEDSESQDWDSSVPPPPSAQAGAAVARKSPTAAHASGFASRPPREGWEEHSMSLAEGEGAPRGWDRAGRGCQRNEWPGMSYGRRSNHDKREWGFPQGGPWKGWGALLTSGLAPLVVDVEGAALVHAGDDLVVGAVEAVHADHTGLLLGVGVVRVGGVEIILKHSQAVQVLNLRGQAACSAQEKTPPSAPESPPLPIQTPLSVPLTPSHRS